MSAVLRTFPLGFPWETADPFLFCVHHDDAYPAGNAQMGPKASLAGRDLGQDFTVKDGFRMYHGQVVPGFPQHPHRGFETVTIVRRGLIDHSDSLGAAARFGHGDVQWLTAGAGVVHSEMFPLVHADAPNPVELFQIWLNLPRADKLAPPHFTMLWGPTIPRVVRKDAAGRQAVITLISGALDAERPPSPPPHSWASRADSHVLIWTLALDAGATLTLPAVPAGVARTLYAFAGAELRVDDTSLERGTAATLRGETQVTLTAGAQPVECLLLGGKPIAEPVAQYGPFVMTTPGEIQAAFADYRRTGFGGWPWDRDDPVHPRDAARFARYPDGRREEGP